MKLSKLMVGLAVVLAASVAANAAVTGIWTTAAAPNNMTTWTLTLTSTTGDITSLDLSITPPAGESFNQPMAAYVDPSAWQDSIGGALYTMVGVTKAEETHFLFDSTVTAPGALVGDTTSVLQAPFTGFTAFSGPQGVAQVVMADTVTTWPDVGSQDPTYPDQGNAVIGGQRELITIIPEPATLALLAMGGVALLRRRR